MKNLETVVYDYDLLAQHTTLVRSIDGFVGVTCKTCGHAFDPKTTLDSVLVHTAVCFKKAWSDQQRRLRREIN